MRESKEDSTVVGNPATETKRRKIVKKDIMNVTVPLVLILLGTFMVSEGTHWIDPNTVVVNKLPMFIVGLLLIFTGMTYAWWSDAVGRLFLPDVSPQQKWKFTCQPRPGMTADVEYILRVYMDALEVYAFKVCSVPVESEDGIYTFEFEGPIGQDQTVALLKYFHGQLSKICDAVEIEPVKEE